MNLVNGLESDVVSLQDRGFNYGDGVFRTFALRQGRPRCWKRHYEKLRSDCARLHIACPAQAAFEDDLRQIAKHTPDCTLKLTVTRGIGPRGYAAAPGADATRIVAASETRGYPRQYQDEGICARVCEIRLARQPALAGVKHLNRLENVLARREWADPEIAEGILCDTQGHVIGGTMSNLFILFEGSLRTPELTDCGVAGVQRARVLEFASRHDIPVAVGQFDVTALLKADEVFLVNSLIDAWQVTRLGAQRWKPGVLTPRVRQWLAADE